MPFRVDLRLDQMLRRQLFVGAGSEADPAKHDPTRAHGSLVGVL
ncbi:MAG TPA: hypothetical protein VL961_06090 [Acidimicrobiales bacterium]|nr:hypothetical protein [Acidimicrobiales bacterium]